MKKIIFSAFVLLLNFTNFASDVDSLSMVLMNRLSKGYDDTAFYLAEKIYNQLIDKDFQTAIQYAALSKQIAENLNDSLKIAQAYNMLGECYLLQKSYFMATEAFFKAYEIFKKYDRQRQLAYTLINIAKSYIAQEIEDIAETKLFEAQKIFQSLNDTLGEAFVYKNLGIANLNLDEAMALKYLLKANILFYKFNDSLNAAKNQIFIAKAYLYLNKLDSSVFYLKSSEKIFTAHKDTFNLAYVNYWFANIYLNQKNYSLAKKYFENSLMLAKTAKINDLEAEDLFFLGKIAFDENNFSKALDYLRQSVEITQTFGFLDVLAKDYDLISQVYEKMNKIDSALKYSKLYSQIIVKNYEQKKSQHFSSFQMNLEKQTQEKELELYKIKTEKEKLQFEKKQYKKNALFESIIVLLTFILVIFLIKRNREKNKTTKLLQEANQMLKHEIAIRKKAENDMRTSEERYRLLFRKTPIGIMQFDDNLIISDVNDKLLEIFSVSRNEIIKKPLDKIFDRNTVKKIIELLDNNNEIYTAETELIFRSKVLFISLTVKKYEINNADNVIKGGIIIIEDLTERKKAEQYYKSKILHKQVILRLLPDNLILCDYSGKVLEAHLPKNPQQELVLQKIEQAIPQEISESFFNYFNLVKENKIPQKFILETNSQGNLFFRLIPDNQDDVILVIISKLTQKGEQIISSSNLNLDSKNQYLRNLKHEIETELLPTYQNIQRGLSFIMLRNFAERIIKIGKKYKNQDLTEFGQKLKMALENFDVFEVNRLIDEFPVFISHFTLSEEFIF